MDWIAFWCCLNPRERNALTLLLPYFSFMGSYIERNTFDMYWLALGYLPNNALPLTFIQVYKLEPGEIVNPDESVTQVLYFDPVTWSSLYEFSLTDDFICAKPCKILTFPN